MSSGMMKTHLKKPTGYFGFLLWQEQIEWLYKVQSEFLKECNEDDCSVPILQLWWVVIWKWVMSLFWSGQRSQFINF